MHKRGCRGTVLTNLTFTNKQQEANKTHLVGDVAPQGGEGVVLEAYFGAVRSGEFAAACGRVLACGVVGDNPVAVGDMAVVGEGTVVAEGGTVVGDTPVAVGDIPVVVGDIPAVVGDTAVALGTAAVGSTEASGGRVQVVASAVPMDPAYQYCSYLGNNKMWKK